MLLSRHRLEGGGLTGTVLDRPALLFIDGKPGGLFGAADGYKRGRRVSTNVQIPL